MFPESIEEIKAKKVVLGPEFFQPSTGGRAPRRQLTSFARRKDDPTSEPAEQARDPKEIARSGLKHRIFDDHAGNECISVWRGDLKKADGSFFPPPWNYQIYVTFGFTASSPQIIPWCYDLHNAFMRCVTDCLYAGLRLDFIFLPDALPASCIRHYRAEKRARVATDIAFVPTYETSGMGALDSKDWNAMMILTHEDIGKHGIKFFRFDPVSEDESGPEDPSLDWYNEEPNEHYLYREPELPGFGTISEPLDQLYKYSNIRAGLEKEYRAAIQEAEDAEEIEALRH